MNLNLNKKKISQFLTKYQTLINLFIAILIVLIVKYGYEKDFDKLILKNKTLTTKMTSYRNSDSLHVAQIEVLTSENNKQFLKIQSQDSMINKLQTVVEHYKKELKKPGSSATIITNTTSVSGTIPTVVNQVIPPSGKREFPVYYSEKHTKWLDLVITARYDSTSYKLNIRNEYSVVVGFDKKRPFAEVTNYNPHTETTDMRTYSVFIPPPKRLSVGIHAGYGIVGKGFGPYFGVGINYDLINLK